jgi:hypothetical protein
VSEIPYFTLLTRIKHADHVDDSALCQLFQKFGSIKTACVMLDPATKRSRNFGDRLNAGPHFRAKYFFTLAESSSRISEI